MTSRFEDIKRLREEEALGNAASRHLLAISYIDDYANVCMSATINSICVAYYKMAKQTLGTTNEFDVNIESFKNAPGIKQIGLTESSILSIAAKSGADYQRNIFKSLIKIHNALGANISKIILDKWGKSFVSSQKIDEIFKEYSVSPSVKTLALSLNKFAGFVKTIDFDIMARDLLKSNSDSGYNASGIVLDCLDGNFHDIKMPAHKPTLNLLVPSTLFISIENGCHQLHEGKIFTYFEYNNLTTDIFREICFVFADYLETDEVSLSIILDFAKENNAEYCKFRNQVNEIANRLISDCITDESITVEFPEEYIKWLVYNENATFKSVGEALSRKELEVNLNLRDIFNEYVKSKVRRLISEAIQNAPDVIGFTLIGREIDNSSFIEIIKTVKPEFKYLKWYNPTCNYILANHYLTGDSAKLDVNAGLSCLKKAADGNYAPALYELAWYYQHDAFNLNDQHKALNLYTQAATQGYVEAQYELAQMYLKGEGLEKPNYDSAILWFSKAESNNHEKARVVLAECYRTGFGVGVNESRYSELVQKFSTDSSNSTALAMLADVHYNGIGCLQDKELGREIYRKAADLGDIHSQMMLGNILQHGLDVPVDFSKAKMWYKKAADAGISEAQYALVEIGHATGDDALCAEYLVKAIRNGNQNAKEDKALNLFPKKLREMENWQVSNSLRQDEVSNGVHAVIFKDRNITKQNDISVKEKMSGSLANRLIDYLMDPKPELSPAHKAKCLLQRELNRERQKGVNQDNKLNK